MMKTSIAFLAAMSLAASGCRKDPGGGDGASLAQLTALKDKLCACKDKACSDKVSAELAEWGQAPDNAADDKQVKAIKKQLAGCLLELEVPGGAAAAGTAGAAGGAAGAEVTAGSGAGAAGAAGGW